MISSKQKNKGFTLVEMIISVGIFTIMSTIILVNYPEFRGRSALDNLTAQIATVYHEAQIYGISVRKGGVDFSIGYGVHIDLDVNNTDLIIFADENKDFNFTGKDTVLETFSLTGGEKITKICAPSCVGSQNETNRVNSVTTVFVRPNPDAHFSLGGTLDSSMPSISIEISNRSGSYKRNVEVYTTGQISVR